MGGGGASIGSAGRAYGGGGCGGQSEVADGGPGAAGVVMFEF
jgi:hypothetical protein